VRSKDSSRQKAEGRKQKAESRQKANADAASLYLECANFGVRRLDGALVGCDLSQHVSGKRLDQPPLINNCRLPTSHSLLTAHCSLISVNFFAAFTLSCTRSHTQPHSPRATPPQSFRIPRRESQTTLEADPTPQSPLESAGTHRYLE
jgi:hypothetical protein